MEEFIIVMAALFSAAVAGESLARFHIPRVVSQIMVGMILGTPMIHHLFTEQGLDAISLIADLGIVLLMFFVGLEINFKAFVKNIKIASGISLWNTTLPLAGGYLVSHYIFGMDPGVSFIIGVCLSVSATALALDMLEELNMFKSRIANMIASTGTVDDIYELILITVSISLIEAVAIQSELIALVQNATLFVLFILLSRPLVRWTLNYVQKNKESALVMVGLIIPFMFASVSNYLGFSPLIGALISGIMVRHALVIETIPHRPWAAHHISRHIHSIAFGFLVPIFFVHVGIQTDITAIWKNINFGIIITAIAITGTVVGTAIGYYISTRLWKEGILLGWALNSKGDTELVIASMALNAGIINPDIYSSLIFMAVVSTLVSPFIFRHLLRRVYITRFK